MEKTLAALLNFRRGLYGTASMGFIPFWSASLRSGYSIFQSSFWLMHPWKATADSLSSWVPVAHLGDPHIVPGFWHWPWLTPGWHGHLGSGPMDERSKEIFRDLKRFHIFFLCFSAFQTTKCFWFFLFLFLFLNQWIRNRRVISGLPGLYVCLHVSLN